MTWNTPKTWVDQNLVTADDLNTHLRDNLNALKSPPTAQYVLNQASDYTTNSGSFIDVDGANLALTITPSGSTVIIGFFGTVINAGVFFDIAVDGTRIGGDDGLVETPNGQTPVSFVCLATVTAGVSHTFKLQWKSAGATATLYAGAGTSGRDLHPQFWVREIS